ncbi:MAG: dihydrofolate reductase [Minisyncoccota bacterium]
MKRPEIDLSLIVAMTPEGAIGRNNTLPWRIPSYLQRLKRLTLGHPVIMGRKNWESITNRPLPGRTNIVVTRQEDYVAEGAMVTYSIEDAYAVAKCAPGADEIFVIGGAEIYQQFIRFVQKAYITKIHASVAGDTHFPYMRMYDWRCEDILNGPRHPMDEFTTSLHIYERVAA